MFLLELFGIQTTLYPDYYYAIKTAQLKRNLLLILYRLRQLYIIQNLSNIVIQHLRKVNIFVDLLKNKYILHSIQ